MLRGTINGVQTTAYVTGTGLLFSPAAPVGAIILTVTTVTDVVQMGIELFVGVDY